MEVAQAGTTTETYRRPQSPEKAHFSSWSSSWASPRHRHRWL